MLEFGVARRARLLGASPAGRMWRWDFFSHGEMDD
jgi:hypothetical protein